jgi:uncharacterized integral membrane protein
MVVALFSVQNADPICIRFFVWQYSMSAALVILLAAFLGALVGLLVGFLSHTSRNPVQQDSTQKKEP